jgi:hypothetical protein
LLVEDDMAWLISKSLMDFVNLPCSLELEAEFSEDTCSGGEPSVLSSGNPTQLAYLPPDRMTDFSRLSRFGMTFKPLTADRGEAVLMSYLEAFPAKTSAWLEREQELTEPDQGCGDTWRGSLARFDRVTSSWKTAQLSLLGDSVESSVIWPRSGMTAAGQCWELPTLGQTISGTDSGLWPTLTVCGNYNRKGASATSGDGLATAVKMWPTPTAHNAKEGGFASEHERNTPTLAAQAGGSLNPTWVEWLMGWPLGWTDLKPLVTDKFHCVQQKHGNY